MIDETSNDCFEEYLEALLKDLGVDKVDMDDAQTLHQQLISTIRNMNKARGGLSHTWIQLKKRGRIVIPDGMRKALGWNAYDTLDCHLYPNQHKPKGILLVKET